MLENKLLAVTVLAVPALQTLGLARPSLKVSLSPCFVSPFVGFGHVSIFLTLWTSPNSLSHWLIPTLGTLCSRSSVWVPVPLLLQYDRDEEVL